MCAIIIHIDLVQLITGIALPLFYSNLKASDLDVFIGISIFDFMIICLLNGIIVNDFRFNSCVFGLFYSQSPSPRISYSENTNAIFQILIQFSKKCIVCSHCIIRSGAAAIHRVKKFITQSNTGCIFR